MVAAIEGGDVRRLARRGSVSASRAGMVLLSLGLVIALGAWYTANQGLDQTATSLASANAEMTELEDRLSETEVDLDTERTQRSKAEGDARDAKAASAAIASCVDALEKDRAALISLAADYEKRINIFGGDSAIAGAIDQRQQFMGDAVDAYYEAYSAAWDGRVAAASKFIVKGNSALEKAQKQGKTLMSEVRKANESTDALEAESTAVVKQIYATIEQCSETTAPVASFP